MVVRTDSPLYINLGLEAMALSAGNQRKFGLCTSVTSLDCSFVQKSLLRVPRFELQISEGD